MPSATTSEYIHGHHPSVVKWHSARTAENSAAYLLPHLKPDMRILDVGCGPGSITLDLAARVPHGSVVGLDIAPDILPTARAAAASRGLSNVEFVHGDALVLPYADDSFDVVHAHQVLAHLANPLQALREMRRVARRGAGIVAVREGDWASAVWWPRLEPLEESRELYYRVARAVGAEPDAGRRLGTWAAEAGFERANIAISAGTMSFSTPEERKEWGKEWAERVLSSRFGKLAIDGGHATPAQLNRIATACLVWGNADMGWYAIMQGELIARVGTKNTL